MLIFGDTFRSLSLLRDSLMFRVDVDEGDTSLLRNELKKLGWAKAEKLMVLLTDRMEEINRKQEVWRFYGVLMNMGAWNDDSLQADLEDFDEEIYEELKKAWGDLSVFMKVSFFFQSIVWFHISISGDRGGAARTPQRKIRILCEIFWRRRYIFSFFNSFFNRPLPGTKGEDHNLSLSLLFESGICPPDYPDLNIPTITWDNIQVMWSSCYLQNHRCCLWKF